MDRSPSEPNVRRWNIRCPYPCKKCRKSQCFGTHCEPWQDWFRWYWAGLRRKYLKNGR